MKFHTGVDAGSGFVHTVEATAANVHDVTVAARLLREDDEVVYGDNAYLGLEKRDEIKQIRPDRKEKMGIFLPILSYTFAFSFYFDCLRVYRGL